MATIRQVLKKQAQVDAATEKLIELKNQRYELLQACPELNKPHGYGCGSAETFVTVDAVPCRIRVDPYSNVTKEELRF